MLYSFTRLLRVTFRNKTLTIINITGLSVGLFIAMFLLFYTQYESSYDQHFENKERIYRMVSIWEAKSDAMGNMAICLGELSSRLKADVPEVEETSRLYDLEQMAYNVRKDVFKARTYLVDSTFTDIFKFNIVTGSLQNALSDYTSCIITESMAKVLFPKGENPIGQEINMEQFDKPQIVKAVIKDIPENSHFKFDILLRLPDFGWRGLEYYTYLKFKENVDITSGIDKCNAINTKMLKDRFLAGYPNAIFNSAVEPLTSLHTTSIVRYDLSPHIDQVNLHFIILITIFILSIALSNFIALNLIQGEKRSTEICVRKTNGATRWELIRLLFSETAVIVGIAFVLAIILYFSLGEVFGDLIGFSLSINVAFTWQAFGLMAALFIIVVLFAGFYPAIVLSRFNPSMLVGQSGRQRRIRLTYFSVMIQFAIVIFFILAVIIVNNQMSYVKDLPLGFSTKNILTVQTSVMNKESLVTLRNELTKYPFIKQVGVSQGTPLQGFSGQGIKNPENNSNVSISERRVGYGTYLDIFQIPILQGRNFSEGTDETDNIVISETVAKALNFKDPIGEKVEVIGGDTKATIIGVAKDVIRSAHSMASPIVYTCYMDYYHTLFMEYDEGYYEKTLNETRSVLKEKGIDIYSIQDFADSISLTYSNEHKTYHIFILSAVVAILLALLGLLALAGFVVQQKEREISVRRVFGAHISQVIGALNGYILLRILPAAPIGLCACWYVMASWLQNFAYSITLQWWMFILALFLTFIVAVFTVCLQTYRAAIKNPAEILKKE